ncbi:MAG: hypothetical protein DMF47_03010 [Verrucomicrobia bacterium]|nr:MAG: hypothetical protein DMF47_03010 [Verrucomicrobiota bacterium]
MRLILRRLQLTAKRKNFHGAKSRCHFQLATYFPVPTKHRKHLSTWSRTAGLNQRARSERSKM